MLDFNDMTNILLKGTLPKTEKMRNMNRVHRLRESCIGVDQEWVKEPDNANYELKEYHLIINRNMELYTLNGYVGVSKEHPYFGLNTSDDRIKDIGVHWGITYAGNQVETMKEDLWYFGFDTAHSNDYVPGYGKGMSEENLDEFMQKLIEMMGGFGFKANNPNKYRNFKYVSGNVAILYKQLRKVKNITDYNLKLAKRRPE